MLIMFKPLKEGFFHKKILEKILKNSTFVKNISNDKIRTICRKIQCKGEIDKF